MRNVRGTDGTPFVMPTWSGRQGIPSLVNYLAYCDQGYSKNAVVYACVREVSRSAPSARLRVVRDLGNSQYEPWEDHPLQGVLNKPNKFQSQFSFLELYYTYLNMDGNAFVIREREGERTTALWLVRPDRMRPVVDRRSLLGYVYVADDGERVPFTPEEVIHDKFPNPGDPFEGLGRGVSPLSAAAMETDVDNKATNFMDQFFNNAAVPFGLLKSKNILDDAEVQRIRARIKQMYTGSRKWHEMMILDADAEYERMGLDLDEMAFTDLRAISETRICAAFKVPPVLIGIKAGLDASTYSNYVSARRGMWEDKIIPDNTKTTEVFTAAMEDELQSGVITNDYSNVMALQDDRNQRFARSNQAVTGGWITVNEGRREVGLNPLPGGDVFLRPLASTTTPTPGTAGDLATGSLPSRRQAGPVLGIRKGMTGEEWEEWGAQNHKLMERVARAWELKYYQAARERFIVDGREVRAILRSAAKGRRKEIDWGRVEQALFAYIQGTSGPGWAAIFAPLMHGLLNDQAEEWLRAQGLTFELDNEEVRAFIENYALMFAAQIGNVTQEALRSLLLQAQEEGWSITKLIDEVGGLYDGWSWERAEMIARSETIRASNAGAAEAYRQAGIREKQWYTAEDERVCGFCMEMHGRVVGVEAVFGAHGETITVGEETLRLDYGDVGWPPLHPMCRCTILPVFTEV